MATWRDILVVFDKAKEGQTMKILKANSVALLENGRVLEIHIKKTRRGYIGKILEWDSYYDYTHLTKISCSYINIVLGFDKDSAYLNLEKFIEEGIIVSGGYKII